MIQIRAPSRKWCLHAHRWCATSRDEALSRAIPLPTTNGHYQRATSIVCFFAKGYDESRYHARAYSTKSHRPKSLQAKFEALNDRSGEFHIAQAKKLREEISKCVRDTFGHENGCRPLQQIAIEASLSGHSVLLTLPTGQGKSLCFQAPALLQKGLTVVVSPLTALIEDQVSHLRSRGIAAASFSHSSTFEVFSQLKRWTSVEQAEEEEEEEARSSALAPQLLYVTPERLVMNTKVIEILNELYARDLLKRFVIDEAHCITEWGKAFRPSYREMCLQLRERFSSIPVSLLTATGSQESRDDFLTVFGFDQIIEGKDFDFLQSLRTSSSSAPVPGNASALVDISSHFDRADIDLFVVPKTKTYFHKLLTYLKKRKDPEDSVLIYTLTQTDAETLAARLRAEGFSAASYHGGQTPSVRKSVQKLWMTNRCSILCATVAFGMGIDKPDLRYVFHDTMPLSISAYVQQVGRAGRDGRGGRCTLFYSYEDTNRAKAVLEGSDSYSSLAREGFEAMVAYCEETGCRRKIVAEFLGSEFCPEDCERKCNCVFLDKEIFSTGEDAAEYDDDSELSSRPSPGFSKRKDVDRDINYLHLKLKTQLQSAGKGQRLYQVSRKTLQVIARLEPQSSEELASVKGVHPEVVDIIFPTIESWLHSKARH